MLCGSQFCLFKAFLVFKFSRMNGIDELFFGRFLLINNILFLLLLQLARFYFFGSMHESSPFQIYTGIRVSYVNDFWPKFIMIVVLSASISCISFTWKKTLEKYKDYKIQKSINVNLESQNYCKAAVKLASVTSRVEGEQKKSAQLCPFLPLNL